MNKEHNDTKPNAIQRMGTVLIASAVVMLVFARLIVWTEAMTLTNVLLLAGVATLGAVLIKVGDHLDA